MRWLIAIFSRRIGSENRSPGYSVCLSLFPMISVMIPFAQIRGW